MQLRAHHLKVHYKLETGHSECKPLGEISDSNLNSPREIYSSTGKARVIGRQSQISTGAMALRDGPLEVTYILLLYWRKCRP